MAVAALMFFGSCASRLSISGGAPSVREVAVQQRNQVAVKLLTPRFSSELDRLPALLVTFTNRGAAPVAVTADDIKAFSGATPVRVYSSYEL